MSKKIVCPCGVGDATLDDDPVVSRALVEQYKVTCRGCTRRLRWVNGEAMFIGTSFKDLSKRKKKCLCATGWVDVNCPVHKAVA
jgi:hypothetical protein